MSVWKSGSPTNQVVSDAQGRYAVSTLAAGAYDMMAKKSGYVSAPRYGVSVSGGQTATANFTLSAIPGAPPIVATNRTPEQVSQPVSSQLKIFDGQRFRAITNVMSEIKRTTNTVVFTHGWNSKPDVWATNMAAQMRAGGVHDANLLAWDWSTNAGTGVALSLAFSRTVTEGENLARALTNVLGLNYSQGIHFIGHSLGTLVNATAADYLHTKTSNAFDWHKTQMTLLDNALLANIEGKFFAFHYRQSGAASINPELDDAFAMKWVWPLPNQFAWADNYISLVGVYQPGAVNTWLNSAFYRPDPIPVHRLMVWHGYACDWYAHTAEFPTDSQMGNRYSFERLGVNAQFPTPTPYPLGSLFNQTPFSQYTLVNVPEVAEYLTERTKQLAEASVEWGVNTLVAVGEKVGDVAVTVAEASVQVWDAASQRIITAPVAAFRVALTSASIAPASATSQIRAAGEAVNGVGDYTNSPTAVWLPVHVPTGANLFAFDFTFQGDPGQDMLSVCVNGTNVFELETRFMPSGQVLKSGFIVVSEWAGQDVELFFGLLGGTSTNASLTIEAMSFYQVASPTLAVETAGNAVVVSWPATADGYQLESVGSLTNAGWTSVTNAPTTANLRHYVTNSIDSTSRFYRLRRD